MRKLYYRYEVNLEFDPAVKEQYVNLRCIPMTNASQQIYGSRVRIDGADYITRKKDGAGNLVTGCRIQAPHTSFSVISEGVAFVDVNCLEREKKNPVYAFFTDYTSPDEGMKTFYEQRCQPLFKENNTPWEETEMLMHLLYERFRYQPGVTGVKTTACEAFQAGAGVCQDYAQILITLCRMRGIEARYVAGFLTGEGATHGWVEIFDGGYWYGFDPTHDRTVTDGYIKVAHGRDGADCPLEQGIFRGLTTQKHWVKVIVTDYAYRIGCQNQR